MADSLLPQGHKIQVLITIEGGKVFERVVNKGEHLMSIPSFVELAERAGLLVTKETHRKATADALSCAQNARELLYKLTECQSDADTVEYIYSAVELVNDAINSLKEANAGN